MLAKPASIDSVKFSGVNILARELKARAYQDSKLAALLALLGVLLLPYFHYHRLRSGLLALIPLGIGITSMFGLMDVFGMRLNLVNIFAVILIMGIGVDYGIYVLDRYYESGQCDVSLAVNQTGKAVRMAALTAIFGFGSVVYSDYPGLISIGIACILGVGPV